MAPCSVWNSLRDWQGTGAVDLRLESVSFGLVTFCSVLIRLDEENSSAEVFGRAQSRRRTRAPKRYAVPQTRRCAFQIHSTTARRVDSRSPAERVDDLDQIQFEISSGRCDQTVPLSFVAVDGDQELPVVEIRPCGSMLRIGTNSTNGMNSANTASIGSGTL